MNLNHRLLLAAGILGVAVLAQLCLQAHLSAAPESVYPDLANKLEAFPLTLGEEPGPSSSATATPLWRGAESPRLESLRKLLDFEVNGLVSRDYSSPSGNLGVNLYIVYSRSAGDRKHHPAVCLGVAAGYTEDSGARTILYLDEENNKRPVQRVRFQTGSDEYATVYYWHYTFEPTNAADLSFLQQFHQKLRNPAPSITVEVTSTAPLKALKNQVEKGLLPLIDEAMQRTFVTFPNRMGCDRLPYEIVD